MATSFHQTSYDLIREGCRRSAAVVVPIFLQGYKPHTVYDVGGGEGFWAQEFDRAGCLARVLDGAEAGPDIVLDLANPFPGLAEADLAVCLEVAEHLPEERADGFIQDLCSLAPVVLFSAAIPEQGGIDHLNEQWPGYWVERFARQGFECSGALRWEIWDDFRVENWYRQNILVAARNPSALPRFFDTPLARPWPVVHPVLYEARV